MMLIAEHEIGPSQIICNVIDFAQAERIIEEMEENGSWPEGFNAVVEYDDRIFLYTDEWREIV